MPPSRTVPLQLNEASKQMDKMDATDLPQMPHSLASAVSCNVCAFDEGA